MELQTIKIKLKVTAEPIFPHPKCISRVLPVHTIQKHLHHLISLLALPPSSNIEPSRLSFSDLPHSLKAIPVMDGWDVYPLGQDTGETQPWKETKKLNGELMHHIIFRCEAQYSLDLNNHCKLCDFIMQRTSCWNDTFNESEE